MNARVPPGTSQGGQFAPEHRSESTTTLDPSDETLDQARADIEGQVSMMVVATDDTELPVVEESLVQAGALGRCECGAGVGLSEDACSICGTDYQHSMELAEHVDDGRRMPGNISPWIVNSAITDHGLEVLDRAARNAGLYDDCGYCGNEVPDDEYTCPSCGAPH